MRPCEVNFVAGRQLVNFFDNFFRDFGRAAGLEQAGKFARFRVTVFVGCGVGFVFFDFEDGKRSRVSATVGAEHGTPHANVFPRSRENGIGVVKRKDLVISVSRDAKFRCRVGVGHRRFSDNTGGKCERGNEKCADIQEGRDFHIILKSVTGTGFCLIFFEPRKVRNTRIFFNTEKHRDFFYAKKAK